MLCAKQKHMCMREQSVQSHVQKDGQRLRTQILVYPLVGLYAKCSGPLYWKARVHVEFLLHRLEWICRTKSIYLYHCASEM